LEAAAHISSYASEGKSIAKTLETNAAFEARGHGPSRADVPPSSTFRLTTAQARKRIWPGPSHEPAPEKQAAQQA
jgi:hypothetical protein